MKNKNNLKIDFLIFNLKLAMHKINLRCHETARAVAEAMRRKGHNVKVVDGIFQDKDNNLIKHSWIETKDFILETDTRQLGISNKPWAVLNKLDAIQFYEPQDILIEIDEKNLDKAIKLLLEI